MNFNEWLAIGLDNKWVGPVRCETHDGTDMTDEEMNAWDLGEDPCILVMRVWE